MSLKYKKYRKNKLAIYGDRDKHEKALKTIGARWNSTLPEGPGWTIYDTRETRLQELIVQLEQDENVEKKIDTIKKSSKSRKNQKKYHLSHYQMLLCKKQKHKVIRYMRYAIRHTSLPSAPQHQ